MYQSVARWCRAASPPLLILPCVCTRLGSRLFLFGEKAKELTDEDIHDLGERLLVLTSVVVKRRVDGTDTDVGTVDCTSE